MSQEVLEAQKWLNATYGNQPGYQTITNVNGLPGSAFSAAVVSAMQVELGMGTVTGVFADQTSNACDAAPLTQGKTGNRVKIMQCGLYGKGYDPGRMDGVFDSTTTQAVNTIQQDAGLQGSQISGSVKGLQMKAILGVDEYKLVSNGNPTIRIFQQDLNHRYLDYTGLCACDGHYSRSTNTALIYALQCEEGMSTSTATGEFGSMTKSYCPDLGDGQTQWNMNGAYTSQGLSNCIKLAQYALYCIGCSPYYGTGAVSIYDSVSFDGVWSSSTKAALNSFQQRTGLPQRSWMGLDEWMSLLVSTGNPNRNGSACDCSTQVLTQPMAQALVNDQYEIVGRYLTGTVGGGADKRDKSLTLEEIAVIFDAGLNLFCIFQDDEDWWQNHDDLSGYFSYNRGYQDAEKAVNAARDLRIPLDEYIYFAVDYDFMQDEVYSGVVPHFKGITDYMNDANNPYQVGIYSARNTCGIISAQGLAASSFVSDMSTGYSGNFGFPLPDNWAFDQIKEYTCAAGYAIDKNATSGRYKGFNWIEQDLDVEPIWEDELSDPVKESCATPGMPYTSEVSLFMTVGSYEEVPNSSKNRLDTVYALAVASCGYYQKDPSLESSVIQSVTIEVNALNGVTFDTIDDARQAGCYPPPSDNTGKSPVAKGGMFLLKQLLKEIKLHYVSWMFTAGDIITMLVSPPTTEVSSTQIKKTYIWSSWPSETAQTLVFRPRIPLTGDYPAFEIKYTVSLPNGKNAVASLIVNSQHN